MAPIRIAHFSPARILLLSVITTIIIGALILSLPICRKVYMAPIDLLFTSTAVTCVAGFLTVSLTDFTTVGHTVILILMQIGGLGIVTLTLFLMSLFLRLNFSTQLMAGQLLDLDSWKNIKNVIFFIMGFTLLLELISAVSIFYVIRNDYSLGRALFLSAFHAASGFCHAGFSLFPNNFALYKESPLMLIPMTLVIFASSLGFLAWYEIIRGLRQWRKKKRFVISLHTKLVLFISFTLVFLGTTLFLLVEYKNTLSGLSPFISSINALFNIVASRGTGFTTVNVANLHNASLFLFMVLTFIGSSPGSPGSGIKTTTFAVFFSTVKSAIASRPSVSLYGRKIAKDQVDRALSIIALSLAWLLIAMFLLLLTDSDKPFIDMLFELLSAFGTLGLSTGITQNLSYWGKHIIITTMVLGRVGSLAFFLALFSIPRKTEFTYPEERIMLG
ncbi:hypothetical protein KC460_01905 [Candidatus Dependentiae bacterium]|nr:hypothetical protein [Candidatus Dependentiae bacterium]